MPYPILEYRRDAHLPRLSPYMNIPQNLSSNRTLSFLAHSFKKDTEVQANFTLMMTLMTESVMQTSGYLPGQRAWPVLTSHPADLHNAVNIKPNCQLRQSAHLQ